MKRSVSLILVLSLLFLSMLCIIPSAEATGGLDTLKITEAAVEFTTNVNLYFKVYIKDFSVANRPGSGNGAHPDYYTTWSQRRDLFKLTVDGVEAEVESKGAAEASTQNVVYRYANVGAKNIGDELAVKLYYIGDGSEVLVDSITYSVVDYALTASALYPDDAKLISVLDTLLAFGGAAQTAFNHTGAYDLTSFTGGIKDLAVVQLHGNATFASGSKKAFVQPGQTVTATATASTASWVTAAAQQIAPSGKTASIAYASGKQDVYVIDSDVYGANPFVFDMDKYTGSATTYNTVGDVFGVGTSKFSITALGTSGSVTLQPGYMTITNNPNIISEQGESSAPTNPMSASLLAAMSTGAKTFTLTFTLATDTSNYSLNTIGFRHATSTDIVAVKDGDSYTYADNGRYYFLRRAWGNAFGSGYNEDATTYGGNAINGASFITIPKTSTGVPTEFVTVHVVFDLVNHTASYYEGTTLKTVRGIPASEDFFKSVGDKLSYLEIAPSTNSVSYLKSLVITQGNFVEAFKAIND